ncbi:MAG: lipopolysaccharide biosynthesis protein [Firmicutes bacterium]|nr:lipopolysaccharide biosynthesis protein [Bacillota bacterium]
MKISKILSNSSNVERDAIIWNMIGSMIMAFQSVIMLMILTRTLGLLDAGVFTIAYANANLFLTIGKYGMRNFQVSDVKGQFDFEVYKKSRLITSILMMVVSGIYVVYAGNKNGYTLQKSMIIIWMCIFKMVDAVEDVYHGFLQQKGRLDIAGKAMTIRLVITITVFAITVIISNDLLFALIISTVATMALMIYLTQCSYKTVRVGEHKNGGSNVWKLLRLSFPLFLGSFLAFYIGNAPKYAIDSILSDELQACYGFIAMPVFVIGLLNNFIFNPMIHKLSVIWEQRKMGQFYRIVAEQIGVIVGITIVCIAGGGLVGTPVLSVLYNTDLTPYKMELIILLLGGGFLALSGFLVTVITIIRFQKYIVAGYGIVAFFAFYLSPAFVKQYAIMGAAMLYLILMVLLCIAFCGLMIWGIRVKRRES